MSARHAELGLPGRDDGEGLTKVLRLSRVDGHVSRSARGGISFPSGVQGDGPCLMDSKINDGIEENMERRAHRAQHRALPAPNDHDQSFRIWRRPDLFRGRATR